MRLAWQTVICCCVFTLVLPLVRGATGDLNSSLKKRFRVWLQSRTRRDLHDGLVTASEPCQDVHVEPQEERDTSGAQLNIRSKRSAMASSKSIGCVLVTCSYQDLLHRLHMFNDKNKEANAPGEKMGSKGYGRRRRSLLDSARLGLQTERRRWIIGAGQGGRRRQTPPRAA